MARSNPRSCKGYIEVDGRVLGLLRTGAKVHFSPKWIKKAGWADSASVTMRVVSMTREMKPSVPVFLYLHDPVSNQQKIVLDSDGRYVVFGAENHLRINDAARALCVFVVPLYVGLEGPLCPFCGDVASFKQSADFCDREDHGPLPGRNSRGVAQFSDLNPSWVQETAPPTVTFSSAVQRLDRAVRGGSRRKRGRAAHVVKEGVTCFKCNKGVFEWHGGAYKCNNSACWYVHT